ncbi:MAG: histidinol-phosphate transaminase [Clostridia bacterium]|nr:histidinol-phosphate transaminase [Clostridia bacterium]
MSKFINEKTAKLTPYVPGEQPQDKKYVKLNTNESPFPPSAFAVKFATEESLRSELYPDPEYNSLVSVAAEKFGLKKENLLFTNGSDEALNYAFAAYCSGRKAVFADITYGFYRVFADLYSSETKIIPLSEDFSVVPEDYFNAGGTVFIANPNAPTGKVLSIKEILSVVGSNPENVVVIDEAYIDFGGESVLPYVNDYENLIVVRTFSKSRSLAGARVGFAAANEKLIADLKTVKYSTNPYNMSRISAAMAVGALIDEDYFTANCKKVIENRAFTTEELKKIGFTVLDSKANFVFAKKDGLSGNAVYEGLKERGVLVRYFDKPRINDYVRITIGSKDDCVALISAAKSVVKESL